MSTDSSSGKPQPDSRLFGRAHDFVMLLLGFLLTTLGGGYLSYEWQSRAASYERVADQRRLELQAASRVFEELSRLLDTRLYRMRRLHTGIADPDRTSGTLTTRWDAYREALFAWNENLNRNLALTQRYFGNEARDKLENQIAEGFRELGSLLEGSGYPAGLEGRMERYHHRQEIADRVNNQVYDFDIMLIESIQAGSIGRFRGD